MGFNNNIMKYNIDDVLRFSTILNDLICDIEEDPAIVIHSLIFYSEFMSKYFRFNDKELDLIRKKTKDMMKDFDLKLGFDNLYKR